METMNRADALIADYRQRTGQPFRPVDALHQWQWTMLHDMLVRLEVILEDERVPAGTIERVIRCMLYGSPNVGDAEHRAEQERQMKELFMRLPPEPVRWPQ
jgi:hypothetical protein